MAGAMGASDSLSLATIGHGALSRHTMKVFVRAIVVIWALLSIGALVLPKHANDPNTALARAEEALTEARRQPSKCA